MTTKPTILRTWKVQQSSANEGAGCVLTINGQSFELGASLSSIAWELQRVAESMPLAVVAIDEDKCHVCGEAFATNDNGITNHVDVDGEVDYDTDQDHVAHGPV